MIKYIYLLKIIKGNIFYEYWKKFTKEQLNELNKLDNPNLTSIIRLSKKLGISAKDISNYLIDKELKQFNK